ncbi:MAG: inorganic phosphate transporter [Planctomycetota bacterium]
MTLLLAFDPFAGLTTNQAILLCLAVAFGFYMAWNIGANDVANAMGTSVGSGALTLKWAIILAAIFEFSGAYLVGSNVSETVRKGIFDPIQVTAIEVQDAFDLEEPPSSELVTTLTALIKEDAESIAELEAESPELLLEARTFIDQYPDFRKVYEPAQQKGSLNLAMGMIAALLAAGLWLQIASYFGWPVSTTHSIVGAVVGFGCVALGIKAVDWVGSPGEFGGVAKIAASWLVSPLLAGSIAYLLFRFVQKGVLNKPDPVKSAKRMTPVIVFFMVMILAGMTAFKGLKHFWKSDFYKDLGLIGSKDPLFPLLVFGAAAVLGIVCAAVAAAVVRKIDDVPLDTRKQFEAAYVARSLGKMHKHMARVQASAHGEVGEKADSILAEVRKLEDLAQKQTDPAATHSVYRKVEKIFMYLQILSACFVAFAHGANDVANAIGPLSAAVQSIQDGAAAAKSTVPAWALLLGGTGIIVGLATWGWRVMQTIGKKITELTPTRGFCAELAAATTILIASLPFSWAKVPISTTHTLVGAVLGVGMARGIGAINLNTVRDIAASWVITIPAGAGLCIVFYYVLRLIFA